MGYPKVGPADLPGLVPNSEGFMLDVEVAILVGFATIVAEGRRPSDPAFEILEVGCLKGRTTSALLHVPGACVTVIDDFKGPRDMPEAERQNLRAAFIRNLEQCSGVTAGEIDLGLRVLEGDSVLMMAKLLAEPQSFDLILVDADHTAESVERDARAAWSLLAEGGYLFFDDIDWRTVRDGIHAWTSSVGFPNAIHAATPKLGYMRKVGGRAVT